MTTTILWPADVKNEGYLYGWDEPLVVVAGVLQADSASGQ